MANTLSIYDPIFYAQEGIQALEKQLGLAGRVHRGYDKNPQDKGSVISIPVPSTFAAQDAAGSASDISANKVDINLNYWREVRFKLTEKELSFTKEKIISDHIRPAAYALADDIDQKLAILYKDVGGWYGTPGTTPSAVSDITGVRKVLQKNAVPDDGMRHLMIDEDAEDKFLQLAAFNNNAGAPSSTQETLLRGSLGTRFNLETFMNQNTQTHTAGTGSSYLTNSASLVAGTTVIPADTGSGTILAGDVVSFAGHTGTYAVASALSGGSFTLSTPLTGAVADNAAITIKATHKVNLAFHHSAFALAMAPLSEMAGQLGQKVATINFNGLSIRSKIYADGGTSSIYVVLDALFGVKTLNPLKAARLAG